MTADDEAPLPSPGEPGPDAPRPYQPKPPLWRSLKDRRVSPVAIALGIVVVLGLMAALGAVAFEQQFFSGPLTATPLTITAVQRAHADHDSPTRFVYVVKLSDGRPARFTSERVYQPGTRLVAMVSRGVLTGRTLVGPPYMAMPDE